MEGTRTNGANRKCAYTVGTSDIELLAIGGNSLIAICIEDSSHQAGSYMLFFSYFEQAAYFRGHFQELCEGASQ